MYQMTIQLKGDNGKCLYQQIYEYIRQEILEGKLLMGEKLPSTRSLAEYLQISRSTVDCAYSQLLSEGYIEARPCKGYFVCPVEELFRLAESREESTVPDQGYGEGPLNGTGCKEKSSEGTGEGIDFSPHKIDMGSFPFGVWKRITRNVLSCGDSDLFSLGDPQGDYDLRVTIGRYLHSSRGVSCRPEQIIVGAGNDYLLMLLEKLLGRHKRMAMENPTYKRAYRIFESFAYRIITVEMDESGMLVPQLERTDAEAVYVMPSHQYPMGTVMPIGRRTELLKWANRTSGRYLIEDDYDSEFRYRGKPVPSLQSTDEFGRVIYMGTFSKAIAPAIRVSYMVLPQPLLEQYLQKCSFYSSTVSRIDQRILNEFIRDGYFERHLNKMRKIYRAKHELLLELLKPFHKDFAISGEHAGLHLLLTDQKGRTEEELIRRADACGVRVYGLSESCIGEETKQRAATVILGYGGLDHKNIREGAVRLFKAWK